MSVRPEDFWIQVAAAALENQSEPELYFLCMDKSCGDAAALGPFCTENFCGGFYAAPRHIKFFDLLLCGRVIIQRF